MKTIFKFFIAFACLLICFSGLFSQPATFEKTIQPDIYSEFNNVIAVQQGNWNETGNNLALVEMETGTSAWKIIKE